MAGAALCFYRWCWSREAVEKLDGKTVLRGMDAFFAPLRPPDGVDLAGCRHFVPL